MVAIEVIDTTIRATDRVDNVVEVETVGWDEIAPAHAFSKQVDGRIGGRVTAITVPASFAQINTYEDGELGRPQPIHPEETPMECADRAVLLGEGVISVSVRFDRPGTIDFEDEGSVTISFEQPTPVTVGFESRVSYPRHTVTVPRTTDGVAAAISYFSSAVRQDAPHRSADPNRRHPPRLTYGDGYDVPEAVRTNVAETGLELVVPDELAFLFPAAPLAYYLGARVVVEAGDRAHLRTDEGDVLAELGALPAYQYEIARLLRRVFLIECLVRYDQVASADPAELPLVDQLSFDPAAYVEASDIERVRTCLGLEFDRVSRALPEWHAVSFVEPTLAHARGLPYLVRDLSAVMLPDAAPGRERDGAHETHRTRHAAMPARALDGGPHGAALAWLGEDDPPDETLYVPTVESYESATRYLDRQPETDRVVVVCTDDDRRSAAQLGAELLDQYGPDTLAIDVHHGLTRAELRDLFEADVDLLHVVGDVEGGIACADGVLDPTDVGRSNARVVFLDGPDGFETGRACVQNGSVAGIVRDGSTAAADRAARTQLFGLLARGCTIDEAVRYAPGPTPGTPFRALGDAVVQVTQSMKLYCTLATVESLGVDRFRVCAHQYIPKAGFIWRPGVEDVPARLCAQPFEFTTTGTQLAGLVASEDIIPIVDGEIRWTVADEPFYPFV
ncbi:hypothetical protein [Halovivax limisalsi]|uniref:hypothetical protein n=1 Tax=Halovivax limisalsi TaxID=1453760 RepID=UPI001FFDEA36|nr:hypothetical protein [Halovivax limisalsi]